MLFKQQWSENISFSTNHGGQHLININFAVVFIGKIHESFLKS